MTAVRLTAPWLGRDLPCTACPEARCVVAACGQVAPDVPLTVSYDARLREAEVKARQLRGVLNLWGYWNVRVARGLSKRRKWVKA